MKLLKILQVITAALMALLLAAAIYTSTLVTQRQDLIQKAARYNIAWLAGQASVEFARLVQTVNAYGVPKSGVDKDEVQLRFEILQNRLSLMGGGDFEDFVAREKERGEIVGDLSRSLKEAQPLIAKISEEGMVLRLMRLLSPVDKRLSRLAAAANVYGGEKVDEDQHSLLRLHWIFSALIAGLILSGLAMIGMMLWNFKYLKSAYDELHDLASSLEATKIDLEVANQSIQTANAELNLHNQILKMRDAELRTQNVRFDAALNNMSHGLCMVGSDGRLIVCNKKFKELFGIDTETSKPGTAMNAVLLRIGIHFKLGESGTLQLMKEQDALIASRNQSSFMREYGDEKTFAIHHQPMSDGGWVATYEDITERRRTEQQIHHMAHHDALTGLPNRPNFLAQLEESMAANLRGESKCAVLCLDLDRFKAVNDTLGHPIGDLLLKAVSARIKECVDPDDVVARFGGDEFAVLKRNLTDRSQLQRIGQALVRAIGSAFMLEGNEVSVGTSVGIAVGFEDGASSDQVLKNADLALYHSKAEGRGSYHFFEARMDAKAQARRLVETDLKRAIPAGELELFYQPLINVANTRISGFESLIRWRHREKGMISPADFIPIAEEVGMIIQIGEWVLNTACIEAVRWPSDIKVAVNLSPIQFKDRNLANVVRNSLAKSGLSPNRLELEITETALVQDMDFTVKVLHQLRDLGVRISLDDFGTGYSSLSYLRSFPFDKIKIDQSFVRELSNRADCMAIVQSVASLGSTLGMSTTAEGVETQEQLATIRSVGCNEAQGYLFSRPVPRVQIGDLLAKFNGQTLVAATAA